MLNGMFWICKLKIFYSFLNKHIVSVSIKICHSINTMKVLLFNGSNKVNGCTFTALSEIAKTLNAEDIETEILQIGAKPIRDCIGCNGCNGKGRCVFDDDIVNEWINKCNTADGFIFGKPVYYAHPSGRILSAMDR